MLKLPGGCGQSTALVSKRDRMVSIYRPNDDPIYPFGLELLATVTVCTDENGDIDIGLSYNPNDVVNVEFMDGDERPTHAEREARLQALAATRSQALGALRRSVSREIEEFCVTDKERRESYAEAREAFHALGVTDEEMGYDSDDGCF